MDLGEVFSELGDVIQWVEKTDAMHEVIVLPYGNPSSPH